MTDFKLPALNFSNPESRKIHDAFSLLFGGKFNNVGSASLDNGGVNTTTTITDPRVGKDSVVLMMPETSNAASENWHIATVNNGSFVISHTAAVTTRTYRYVVIG